MSRGWYYRSGDWNLICDVCSRKIKASESKERWDGFRVCRNCFEQRQPQDFVRARQDKISVPFARPNPPNIFIPNPEYLCTEDGLDIDNFIATESGDFLTTES